MPDDFQLTNARAVIFDVDGTLYDGWRVRRRMLAELLVHYVAHPLRMREIRVLQVYRRDRERLGDAEAAHIIAAQYEKPARRLGMSARQVETIITPWIHERPLRHLSAVRVPGVRRFFQLLRASGRSIAVLSDYPAAEKLAALDLEADCIVSGTDPEIDRLKPHPAGLRAVVERLALTPSECLMIGDRDCRDGEIARRLKMPYLLRDRGAGSSPNTFSDYLQLSSSLR